MMDLGKIRDSLLKQGMDDVVIHFSSQEAVQIKFVNSKVAKTGTEITDSLSVFVAKDKKVAMTSLNDVSDEAVNSAIKKITQFVSFLKPKEYYGIAKGPFKYKEIQGGYDKNVKKAMDNATDIVEEGINLALENGAKRASGILEIYDGKSKMVTSTDVEEEDESTRFYFSIRSLISKNASGHKYSCSRNLKDLNFKEAALRSAEIAKMSVNPSKAVFGKYDVVFDPLPFADILQHVGSACSIFSVESGFSFLNNKLNKKIASDNLTLIDDGTVANGYGSVKADEEGVPTQRNVLIDKGIFKTYLHNTSTAKKYNVKTTASAGLVSPDPWNIILEKGNKSFDEIIKSVKKGIYVTNQWYTRFQNYSQGDFSTIPRDGIFLIENGEIKNPIKGIRINDNLLRMLSNVSEVGNEPKQIVSWEVSSVPVTTPPVLVKDVNITSPD